MADMTKATRRKLEGLLDHAIRAHRELMSDEMIVAKRTTSTASNVFEVAGERYSRVNKVIGSDLCGYAFTIRGLCRLLGRDVPGGLQL